MGLTIRKDDRVLKAMIKATPNQADAFLRSAAQMMTDEIKLSFGSGPPGRTYYRGAIAHVASSPGYPPNTDIGTLINSMHWYNDGKLRYIIADGVIYGFWLETGTANMAPRPFVNPVFEAWRAGKLADLARSFGLLKP